MGKIYFLCTLQCDLEETRDKDYVGGWFTIAEKKALIDTFHSRKQHIPISFDHTAEKEFGSLIPKHERVGHVVDLFVDRAGDLIAKCTVDDDNGAVKRLTKGTYIDGEQWGVSVRIDWSMPHGTGGGRIDKTLTHVALTTTPYLSDTSYIHHWSVNERAVDRTIANEYFKAGDGHCYAAEPLVARLGAMAGKLKDCGFFVSLSYTTPPFLANSLIGRSAMSSPTTASEIPSQQTESVPQQQQQQQQQQSQQQPQQQQQQRQQSTRMVDLEADLKEMEALITPDTPLQSMPLAFRRDYLSKMDLIEAKRNEIKTHFTNLVDEGLLKNEDASFYLKNIHSPDLETKKPVFGYIEASFEANLRSKALSEQKMKELRENNKRLTDDRDRISHELETAKKRIKASSYDQTDQNVPLRHRYDEDSGKTTPQPLYQKEIISLVRYNDKDLAPSDIMRRETIQKAHEVAMFDTQMDYVSAVHASGADAYNKLWQNIAKWNS